MSFVYRYKNAADEVLYIGKTKDLIARHSAHKSDPWFTSELKLDYIDDLTPAEADILETYLISIEEPKHNKAKRWGSVNFFILNTPEWQNAEEAAEKAKKKALIEAIIFYEQLACKLNQWREKWHGTAYNSIATSAEIGSAARTVISGRTAGIRA